MEENQARNLGERGGGGVFLDSIASPNRAGWGKQKDDFRAKKKKEETFSTLRCCGFLLIMIMIVTHAHYFLFLFSEVRKRRRNY